MTILVDRSGAKPTRPCALQDAGTFVASVLDDDGSVTITLGGRCDGDVIGRLREHLDDAIARGVHYLTVEIIGPVDDHVALFLLLGRTQTRLASRRGLLVIRGLPPRLHEAEQSTGGPIVAANQRHAIGRARAPERLVTAAGT